MNLSKEKKKKIIFLAQLKIANQNPMICLGPSELISFKPSSTKKSKPNDTLSEIMRSRPNP